MKRLFAVGVAALVGLGTSGAAAAAEPEPQFAFENQPVEQKEIVFKKVGDVELKMHVFTAERPQGAKPRPAIVLFFGGGWVGGSPEQFFPHCHYLATRGMVAISAEYRVKNRHGTTPVECIKDGKSAVRWVRAHAAELGVDPQKIVAGGGSAGGHVAACTATIPDMDEQGEDTSLSARPDALVLFNPAVDLARLGVRRPELAELAQKISPAAHVTKGLPPTIIFHGKADTTVPIATVERFCRLMNEAGNSCKLVAFDGKSHGFFNYRRDKEAFRQTVRAADEFLVELGILEGKPTL
jgi:acetyl esterase